MRLIDADAAINTLDEQIEQCNKALGSFDISLKDEYAIKVERASLEAYKEQLENMPSAQPERKTGRWIPTASGKGRHECSRCHEYAPCYQDGSEHLSTFCVLCGAKMERGEQE